MFERLIYFPQIPEGGVQVHFKANILNRKRRKLLNR